MKEFFKKLDTETKWGGIFGLIAIIAIIAEMVIGGISPETIVAAVKDTAGTVVSVMVFYIAVKHILKQIKENKTFEDRLKNSLDGWQKEHSNMVVRKEVYDFETTGQPATCFSFGLKTNISDFYNNSTSNNTGWFLRMPILKKENYINGNVVLKFHLNKGTFFEGIEMTKEELTSGYENLNKLFREFINANFNGFACAKGSKQDIAVTIEQPIETQDDIDRMISVINSMYNAYLVAANLKLKD